MSSAASPVAPTWSEWKLNPPSSSPPSTTSETFGHQDQLPSLPVPALDVTLSKLLQSGRALARDEGELEDFERKVREFGREGGVGRGLQKSLEERGSSMSNWIAEWWDGAAYMAYRDTVVINVSYYFGFTRLPQAPVSSTTKPSEDPSFVAASIAATALQFRDQIANGTLAPESVAGNKLCMESYKWMFNACRIPSKPADYAVKVPEDSDEGQHAIVVRSNRFYKLALVDERGERLGWEALKRGFEAIYKEDGRKPKGPPVGVLTASDRDSWTDARSQLLSNEPNDRILRSIETSAFVIALDDTRPSSSQKSELGMARFSRALWHGGERGEYGGNRWWDKPLQWVVFDNGEAGFVGEHSCMDGTPTARLNDYVTFSLLGGKLPPGGPSGAVASVEPLEFQLDEKLEATIERARKGFEEFVGGFELSYLVYSRYGKDGIKKMKTSPDSWTQMIFQLAYALTYDGASAGTYEAAQVRKFKFGRTETVRCCTLPSREWVKAMIDGSGGSGNVEKRKLFREAVKQHGKDMKDASAAMGIDRHLFGLKKSADPSNLPELFSDPIFLRSGTWTMSTSQIYSRNFPGYGWGPVTGDGLGVPYMIHPESLQFTITSRKEVPNSKFIKNLQVAADMMMDFMEAAEKEAPEGGSEKAKL